MIVERFAIEAIEEKFEEVDMQSDFQSASGKYNSLFFKLLEEAERAKKELSTGERADIAFEFDNEDVDVEISRKDFEELLNLRLSVP
jgi:molecular chaperone DnaK (HSP70)